MFLEIFLMVLNLGLVAIPIGGTAGVLAGIDYHRQATGQAPLFSPPSTGGGGGGGGNYSGNYSSNYTWPGSKPNATTVIGGVTFAQYCQQFVQVNVTSKGGQNYTINPNQWDWAYGDAGGMCLNVTTNNNNTYATNTTAPKWSATWQYPKVDAQPVHAFPNIMISGDTLPAKLGDLSMMYIDMSWTYSADGIVVIGPGIDNSLTTPPTTDTPQKVAPSSTAAPVKAASSAPAAAPKASVKTTPVAPVVKTTAPAVKSAAPAAVDDTPSVAAAPTKKTTTTPTAAAAKPVASKKAARDVDDLDSRDADLDSRDLDLDNFDDYEDYFVDDSLDRRYVTGVTFGANVAIDMFFDPNKKLSGKTNVAAYEVMVWFARINSITHPIGYENGQVSSLVVAGVNFTLYAGINSVKQNVLTWIAEATATEFSGSIRPLITELTTLGLANVPSDDDYLGYLAFGSEAYFSAGNVTLDIAKLSMDLW